METHNVSRIGLMSLVTPQVVNVMHLKISFQFHFFLFTFMNIIIIIIIVSHMTGCDRRVTAQMDT